MAAHRIYPDLICPRCGRVFRPKSRRQVFCTLNCRRIQPRPCEQCGEPFIPWHTKTNRFCSRSCSAANRRAAPLPDGLEKFRLRVDPNGPIPLHVPELGPCSVWLAGRNRQGYGRFVPPGAKKTVFAHRWIWERLHGPIPNGLNVLHKCDFPPCVRDEHLFLGTLADNHADQVAKGRTLRGERTPSAKLTEAAIRDIRSKPLTKADREALSRKYGVGLTTIWDVARGRTWKNVS